MTDDRRQTTEVRYDDLIGLPFKENGRGPDVYDCYGVAIEVNRRLGKEIPDYAILVAQVVEVIQQEVDNHKHEFMRVSKPEPGDIVLIRSEPGSGDHFGVIVGRSVFLHASARTGDVHRVRLDHPFYRDRIEGIYRYEEGS